MKHGLLAADLVVRDEDPVEFAGVLENLVDELQRVQAAREKGQQPPSIAVDVIVDGPGPAPNSDD